MNVHPLVSSVLALVPADGHVNFVDNLSYQTAGLAVVILSLGALAIIVQVLGKLINLSIERAARSAVAAQLAEGESPSAPAPSGEAPVVEGRISPETLAIISAAVAVAVPQAHRIVQIRPQPNPWLQAWSLEGRRQIFQSHQTR